MSSQVTNEQRPIPCILPGGCVRDNIQIISSLEDMKCYIGKVIKYIDKDSKEPVYIYLQEAVYGPRFSQNHLGIKCVGIKACSEKGTMDHNEISRNVSWNFIIDDTTFDPCLHGGIIPRFETASYEEFKDKNFPGHQKLGSHCASQREYNVRPLPGYTPYPDFGIVEKAPLTLIRSASNDIDVDISIVYNQTFSPKDPTYPKPTSISNDDSAKTSTYTWKVHVNKDKTLSTTDQNGIAHKVKMIWWEALRNHIQPAHIADSARIPKKDIGSFIEEILTKKGVSAEEQKAFVAYWTKTFENQPGSYVHVRLARDTEVAALLPQMKVNSGSAQFNLQRLYFQFIPEDRPVKVNAMSREQYMATIEAADRVDNAVIDLGGEVIQANGSNSAVSDDIDFNDRFINDYILA